MRVALGLAALALAGCGEAAPGREPPSPAPEPGSPALVPARCPPAAGNCRAASGRVAFVERVDPDGDGDLHVVLVGAGSLSAPGLTILDVARSLRPARDPRPGDRATGAGPVYRGSFGQRQIQVTVFRVTQPSP